MQGLGLPWIGEPAFVAHEATGAVASPQNSWPSIGGPIWESRGGTLGQVGGPKTPLYRVESDIEPFIMISDYGGF